MSEGSFCESGSGDRPRFRLTCVLWGAVTARPQGSPGDPGSFSGRDYTGQPPQRKAAAGKYAKSRAFFHSGPPVWRFLAKYSHVFVGVRAIPASAF